MIFVIIDKAIKWRHRNVNEILKQWQHIFKLDPAKDISDEHLEMICESDTDAVMIGGTDDVTLDGVLDLLYRVRRYALPCILEVSSQEAITPGFDYFFIPSVLNSSEKKWLVDMQHAAIKQFRGMMNWNEIFVEGYCILNPDAKAYQKTNCVMPSEEDVISYAIMAEHFFKLPIFYVEYSGMYGDPSIVKKVKEQLNQTLLFYGGGIDSEEKARTMKQFADTIIVGNVIYTDIEAALSTVDAVK